MAIRKCSNTNFTSPGQATRRIALASVSTLTMTVAAGLVPSSAFAACTTAGTAITCTGDVSAGFSTQGAFDQLTIGGLTTDIGGPGIRITDTSGADFTFGAVIDPFDIMLTGGSLATRNGFNIVTDNGSISGTIAGDILGQVADDATNSSTFPPRNFSALGFEAGTGISITHTGNVDVSMPAVARTSTGARADIATGRFGAIRAESEAGDVSIVNTGNVTLDGGQRNASNTRTSGTAGTISVDFTNGVSDISGILAQGNAAFTLQQTGDVTVSGGGGTLSAESVDGRADVQGAFATTSGIYVPAFSTTGGTFDPTLPRFSSIDVDVDGDIMITGGDLSGTATVTSNGGAAGEAILNITSGVRTQEAAGIQIGSGSVFGNGRTVDVTVNDDITVTGGSATGNALASNGGPGETAGVV